MRGGGASLAHEWPDVPLGAGVAGLAAALLVGPALGGVVTGLAPVAAAVAVAGLALAFGRTLMPALVLPVTTPRYLVTVVVGYAAASIVHLAATAVLNLAIYGALAVDLLVLGGVACGRARRRRSSHVTTAHVTATEVTATSAASTPPTSDQPAGRPGLWLLEVAVLLACAGLAALWTRETIRAVPTAEATGIFPAWQDYFLHGAEVSYLRDYPTYEGRSQYLTAVPQPLYHRGSFALAALYSAIGGVPSLPTATAYWLPTGFLLTVVATGAWGATMAGLLGGAGAVAAVFLVPDASRYGFENQFLSFHWLMQMASGSGYGVSVVLVALMVLVTATPTRTTRALVTAAVLVAASAFFRVHIALLASAMLVWGALFTWRPRGGRRAVLVLAGLAAIALGVLWWMESVSLAPHFLTGRSHPVNFFLSVHTQANDLPSPFRAWRETHGDVANVAYGFGLLLVAGCGAWLGALAVVAGSGALRRMGHRVLAIPVALALASLTVILVVPTPAHGDVTDFGHRPFVLVYLVFSALAGAGLGRLAGEWARRRGHIGLVTGVAVILVLVGLTVPWRDGRRIQQRWVPQYALMPVPHDAFPAAAWVRTHAKPGEQIVAASEDPHALLVALTERRGYLSRPSLFRILGGANADAVNARSRAHAALGAAPTFETLRAFGRAEGVSWYLADTAATQLWPDDVTSRCVYCGDEIRVYDLR